MEIHSDIPYTHESPRNPLHEFDLYLPRARASTTDPAARLLICYVHGGAWRAEDKAKHSALAKKLVHHTGFPVAVPNYRLTPLKETADNILRHPSHAKDILDFLEFLLTWGPPYGLNLSFGPTQLCLMGHSCGAHMLSSIFLDSSAVTPSLTPSQALLNAVKAIIPSEGIYDLDLLSNNFPDYLEWFVARAFGKRASYAPFAVTSYRTRSHSISWLLIHSQGDTMVNFPQSEKMLEHLKSEYGPSADERIFYDTSLTQDHFDIPAGDELVNIVGQFIQRFLTKENV